MPTPTKKPAAAKARTRAPAARPPTAKAATAMKTQARTPPRTVVAGKAATKAQVIDALMFRSGLDQKAVRVLLAALEDTIAWELSKKGPGVFVIPGLLRMKVVQKEATRAKKGINPFTKEPMMIKAKPARRVVKALPAKALTERI